MTREAIGGGARPENVWRAGPDRPGPRVIAHRGDSAHAPENTLEAAAKGWACGADAWELDVQLTRDGVPVILHDASLLRTTDVAERFADDPRAESGFLLADFDLDEVRTLDAGAWFLDPSPARGPRTAYGFGSLAEINEADCQQFASGTVRVPTLAEALALSARLAWPVNVELKAWSTEQPGLVDAVLELITPELAPLVLVSSFDHNDVARVAGLRPDLATGVLAASPLFRPASYVSREVGADAYHPSVLALREHDLPDLRAGGVAVHVYTVNDGATGGLADRLAGLGVAGLFTDDPATLAARWGRRDR